MDVALIVANNLFFASLGFLLGVQFYTIRARGKR